eukprot:4403139-Pleurochrysis_carterae.AAC.1
MDGMRWRPANAKGGVPLDLRARRDRRRGHWWRHWRRPVEGGQCEGPSAKTGTKTDEPGVTCQIGHLHFPRKSY